MDRVTAANEIARVERICSRHKVTSLADFIQTCRGFAEETTLSVAVFGRFKAGKSSFLNHLLGRRLLPVGVIPVTAVVTEIRWGPDERAEIACLDGRMETVPLHRIAEFISEAENRGNAKAVARVLVELPAMEQFRAIRFVDTPGLESVLEQNTEASLDWLPNTGVALVAVGVDPPLSRHDIELIRKLGRYTPDISLLLTKADLLEPGELEQVRQFIQDQLSKYWDGTVPVFPYSTRPGYEHLRDDLVRSLLARMQDGAASQWEAVLTHKLDSLAAECENYLRVALCAAQMAESEREQLRRRILGQKEALADDRLALQLIVRHAAATARPRFEQLLRPEEEPLRKRLHAELGELMPGWRQSLSAAMERFEGWIRSRLATELAGISARRRQEFLEPVRRVERQLSQSLQDFRNRLSGKVLDALGVPLQTAEMEMKVAEPKSPAVRVGKIFDRNWQLLSWAIPMPVVRGLLERHFHRKADHLVYVNLARLVAQWEEAIRASLQALEAEALRRLDSLVSTVGNLTETAGQEAAGIRADLQELEQLRRRLRRQTGNGPV